MAVHPETSRFVADLLSAVCHTSPGDRRCTALSSAERRYEIFGAELSGKDPEIFCTWLCQQGTGERSSPHNRNTAETVGKGVLWGESEYILEGARGVDIHQRVFTCVR